MLFEISQEDFKSCIRSYDFHRQLFRSYDLEKKQFFIPDLK
jgi:hypothetical protein